MSPAVEITLSVAWLGLMLAAAFWCRWDAPIWEAF
jgi:hypothetical protein